MEPKQLITSNPQQIHPDPTLSPLQMVKSLEELDNALHPGHQIDTFPVWSFSEATRPIDTVTQPCKKGRCGVTKY